MQLEVIGPERDHGREGRARAHECEVGARELEQERGPAAVSASGDAVEEVGGRPEVAGPRARADGDVDAGARRIAAARAVVVVLPAVPVMPMRRALPALEQQVAEAGDTRAPGAKLRDARCNLGRPDVEVGDLGLAGSASRSAPGWTSMPSSRSACASGGLGRRGSRGARRCPRRASNRASAIASASNPSIRTSTPGSSRVDVVLTHVRAHDVDPVGRCDRAAAAGRTAHRRGGDAAPGRVARSMRKLLHSQSSARSTKPCRAAFRSV